MTCEELNKFNLIEAKYGLNEAKYKDFCFWNYIRVELIWKYDTTIKGFGVAHSTTNYSVISRMVLLLTRIIDILKKGRIANKQRDILILNHSRRVKCDEFFDCIYISDLAQQLHDAAIVIEEPYNQVHYKPIREKHIVYDDVTSYYGILYAFLRKILNKDMELIEYLIEVLSKPIDEMNQTYGCTVELNEVIHMISRKYIFYLSQKRYYTKALDKVKPNVIVEVVSYSCRCMVINELAKKRNIPTIELQHGSIDSCHEAYNFAKGIVVDQFPDYIFLFADFWKRLDVRMPIEEEKRIVVGFPYLEKMKHKYGDMDDASERKKVLFLSNGAIGNQMAKMACQLYASSLNVEVIYKLHPGEYADWKQRYKELAETGIEVVDNNVVELYSLLASADFIVSCMGSTTIFEALIFHKPVYVYNCDLPEATLKLKEEGAIQIFDNVNDLITLMSNNHFFERVGDFWPTDAIYKIKKNIDAIMKDGKVER